MTFRRILLSLVLSFLGAAQGTAFSLLGPFKNWQTADIGYNVDGGGDIGGPMLPSEGFRWNTPTVYYAYDRAFLEYFGSKGVEAIEAAIKILNDVPDVDSLSPDLSAYPLNTRQINYEASELGLYDLKSVALSFLMEESGVASPETYVWTMRSRAVLEGRTNYAVIRANYDPVTLRQSSYVNGALYSYEVVEDTFNGATYAIAAEIRSGDLRASSFTSVAGGTGGSIESSYSSEPSPFSGRLLQASGFLETGEYFLGMTRDDVGALRKLYSANSLAVEDLTTDTTQGTAGSGGPWGIPVVVTNGVSFTNNFLALRPGRGRLSFSRVNYDSLVGNVFNPFTASYTDRYISNGTLRSRQVSRRVVRPDFLFTAGDLGVTGSGRPVRLARTQTESSTWRSFAAINRVSSGVETSANSGPGVIQGPIEIVFSSTYPILFNTGATPGEDDSIYVGWGSFDGSSAAPIIYPNFGEVNLSLIRSILLRGSDASQWTIAPSLSISTNASGVVTAGATP